MYGGELRRLNTLELRQQDMNDKIYGKSDNRVRVVPLKAEIYDANTQANAQALQRHYMNSKGGSSIDD